MKTIILILSLMYNAFCMGQNTDIDKRFYKLGWVKAIDSVEINFDIPEIENLETIRAKENYYWADSVWLSNDSTYIVFRYFKKVVQKVFDPTFTYPISIETMDAIEKVMKDSGWTTYIVNGDTILPIPKLTMNLTYREFELPDSLSGRIVIRHNTFYNVPERKRDTIPKVYRHQSITTLTSLPPQYLCGRCGKTYQDIGDTTECIPPLQFTKGTFLSDSLMRVMIDSGWSTMTLGTGTVSAISENEEPVYHRKKDTVKIICLYSDTIYTAMLPSGELIISGGFASVDNTLKPYPFTDYSVRWGYFYSVRELHNVKEELGGEGDDPDFNYWEHLYYLDENKKQISKSIIVWDEKEINN